MIDGDSIYNNIAKWVGGDYTDTCATYTSVVNFEFTAEEIIVYPNPFTYSTKFMFSKLANINGKEFSLTLFDVCGMAVYSSPPFSNEITIYRGSLSSGIYFYSISEKSALIGSGKLIIVD